MLLQDWYGLSKTLAEEAALKFAKENGIDLIAIHPGYVLGPSLQPTLNITVEIMLNLVNGTFQHLILFVIKAAQDRINQLSLFQVKCKYEISLAKCYSELPKGPEITFLLYGNLLLP